MSERSISARRALASGLLQSEDRIYLTNALAALAMAGEVDEARAGLAQVIAAAERRGDRLTAAGTGSGEGWCTTRPASSCWPSRL